MIEVAKLSKFYAGNRAIDQVSFRIAEGEIVGLLGLNGAGKSTILKILGCFLLPSAGSARVGGFAVDTDPQAIRRIIGYLPDAPPLYDEMTIVGYLRFVARLKNVAPAQVEARVGRVMDLTNTTDAADQRLGELSHGFRQRVGIAQALVHDPRVIILDEPINGLDPVQIVEMRDLILSLRGRYTVVLSSHILSEITRTCDRVLVVDHGRLVAEGSEATLTARYTETTRLLCELERLPDGIAEKVGAVPGVLQVEIDAAARRLTVQVKGDSRARVAEVIVASGAGLLGMARVGAGLEGVFMKLIKPAEERHG